MKDKITYAIAFLSGFIIATIPWVIINFFI